MRQEGTRDKTALAAPERACYASGKVTNKEESGSGSQGDAVISRVNIDKEIVLWVII